MSFLSVLQVVPAELGIEKLPEPGKYAVGMCFLPTDDARREAGKAAFSKVRMPLFSARFS